MDELPNLTPKQQKFVMRYAANGCNASDAYRFAYDCKNSTDETINIEASKLVKNPKVSQWIQQFRANAQEQIEEEFKYTIREAFSELNDLMGRCKKQDVLTVEKSCIDTKCKLAGLMKEKVELGASHSLADVLDKLK